MMIIGIPKEIKDNEYRVALPPHAVRELIRNGHDVLVQSGAGAGSAFSDEEYRETGAQIVYSAEARAAPSVMKNIAAPGRPCCPTPPMCGSALRW